MKLARIAHVALAALFLAQSVAAVAAVTPVMPPQGSSPLSALEDELVPPEGTAPCHENAAEIVVTDMEDCCASMDGPCCESGCAAPVAVALPVNALPLVRADHLHFGLADATRHPDNPSDGLFRPPRSIR
jgi:hypothetical protein